MKNFSKNQKTYFSLVKFLLFSFTILSSFSFGFSQSDNRIKPRLIATTDGEVDDRSTMIRFLLYSCDFDIAGIVQNNSKFQKSGHSKDKWIEKELDQYEVVLPTLRIHNPGYPEADSLRALIRLGNENSSDLNVAPPNMATKDTPGEQLIINTLLDDDPRPVHVGCWGGSNTVASALWRLKYSGDYTTEQFNKAASKIRIYCIWYQDGGGQWIEDNVKEAFIFEAYRWDNVWDYESWDGNPKGKASSNPKEVQQYMTSTWLNKNVKTGHGSLGALTPQSYISEGDTPSWLIAVNNGLEAHTDYTLGGWGGRGVYDSPLTHPNHITDGGSLADDGNKNKMYWRWVIAAQNDFAARMDWCVASTYNAANHQPIAKIIGENIRTVSVGETVTLDASPSSDPDNDTLNYNWWQYYDADNASTKLIIVNNTSKSNASFVVPNEPGKQLQIICEVTDNGEPNLKAYQRIIYNIIPGSLVSVTGVSISPATVSIKNGETSQLTANTLPAEAFHKAISWSSSKPSVATVDSTGLVKGISAGTATITATSIDGSKTATSKVTVSSTNIPVTEVEISPDTSTVFIGETIQYTATVAPSNATNKKVFWISGNTEVATVDSTGLVKGISAGLADIKVTTKDGGKLATSVVIVTDSTTSISEINYNNGFTFYPNPVSNKLTIKFDHEVTSGAEIKLIDINGKLIFSNSLQGSNHTLDMDKLLPGIYFIKVSNSNKNIVKQITKQ